VARLHREKFAAVLKHESEPGHDNAAAHAAVIALNERNHVAFVVGGAQVNRVALIERRISGFNFFRRVIRINQLATLGRIFFRKQTFQLNFRERRIGIKFRAIGPNDFLCFDHCVQCLG